jgi:iron complex outermembrane receptor protein
MRDTTTRRSRTLAFWTIAGLAAGAGGAFAQTTAPDSAPVSTDSGALQEVVVTAERRSENVQNVPIAITAFTNETLQQRNLTNVRALGDLTPGVNLDQGAPFSGDRSVLSASIRGVGQDDFAFNLNPAVGVYLDGVYLARTIGANQDLLDVDRVEILKGPQGTLFGANTEGGAISIITHTPGNEQKFTGQVTMGSLNRRDVGFTADIPLIKDTLLSSITVSSQNRDGYVDVVPYPTGTPSFVVDPQTAYPKAGYETNDNYGGYGVQTVRGKLLWLASDKTTVTFTADYNRQAQTALPYNVLGVFSGNLNTSTFSTLYNLCISNTAATITNAVLQAGGPPFFGALCSQSRARVPGVSTGGAPLLGAGYVLLGGATIPGANPALNAALMGTPGYLGSNSPRLYFNEAAANTGDIDTTYATGPDFANNNYFGFSLTGTHELADGLSLKSISGYRQIVWKTGTDLDGTPETLQEVTDHQHQWQVSQEFQLAGKALDGSLNYVGGLYYFEEAGYVHDYVPFESLLYVYDIQNDANNKNEAAFIHADYKLNNQLSFTAGGRYTHVQEEFIGGQADLDCFPFGSNCAGFTAATGAPSPTLLPGYFPLGSGFVERYFPTGDNSQSWNVFDPTLAAQFHFTDDAMAYLSWGKGFKAGGWTTRLSAVSASAKDDEFSPEYTKTWELGVKSEWLDHHLKANAALYYTDFTGIQLNIQEGISPVYTNAGNAKVRGAELELQAAVGGGLTLNLAGSYIDAYYTSLDPGANFPQSALPDGSTVCPAGPPACTVAGNGIGLDAKLPKTPKYKMTFYPEYTFVLGNQASLRFITAFTYTAEMFNDSLNTPQLRRPASRNLDASVHYISPDDKYDFAVGGTNITDDRYITVGSPNYGAGEVGGTYNEPAEWYARLTAHFN